MGGRLALVAEVFEEADEATAEEGLPLAIDRDTGGERVLRGEEPAGERQAVGRGVLGEGGKERRNGGRDLFLGAEEFAAVMEERRTRVGGRALAHHERRLTARDLFAQVGEGLGLSGQFGGGLEEALAELGLVMRGGAGEHGFDLGGMAGGGGLRVSRDGDAEMSDGAGIMLFEEHLERPAGGEVGGFVEMEDRGMVLSESAEDLPAARHLAIERGGGVVFLAIGLGGALGVLRGGLGRGLRAGRGVADAIFFFVVGRGGVVNRQSAVALPGLEFAEEEAAEGSFVMGEAGAVVGQRGMGRDLDADGDGALDGTVEGQVIDVALGDVASAEDEAVRLHVERRHRGLQLARAEGFPFRRALAFGVQPFPEALLDGRGASGELAFEGILRRADLLGVIGLALREFGRRDMVGRLIGVIEQRHHRIVIGVQDRVVLMRMALGAVEREAHPSGAGRADAVDHGVEAVFVRVGAAFFVEHRVAVEARGDEVVGRGARQEVAGELLDAELVVGEVSVQGLHDPVTVGPDGARTVFLEAVGVGVAGEVEPATGPAFAVAWRSEQPIDELFVGIWRFVVREGIGFFGRGRDPGEVERHASHERVAVGFG